MATSDKKEYLKTYRQSYRTRIRRIAATLDHEQAVRFNALAKSEGMRPATFLRYVVESTLEREPFVPLAIAEELKNISFLIRGIANNVNQMAHYSNTVRGLVSEDGLLEELRKLEELIKQHTLKQLRDSHTPDDH